MNHDLLAIAHVLKNGAAILGLRLHGSLSLRQTPSIADSSARATRDPGSLIQFSSDPRPLKELMKNRRPCNEPSHVESSETFDTSNTAQGAFENVTVCTSSTPARSEQTIITF